MPTVEENPPRLLRSLAALAGLLIVSAILLLLLFAPQKSSRFLRNVPRAASSTLPDAVYVPVPRAEK